MFFKERQYPVVEQISRSDRCFSGIELGKPNLGIGIYKSLLVNPTHSLERTDIKGILGAQVAGMCSFNFTRGKIIILCPPGPASNP